MGRIVKIIYACCILHNFCIDMGDELSSEDININKEINEEINLETELEAINEVQEKAGAQKRDYLANILINLE
ncbi:putative nuclease harbi1 [Gigaspora margarita]|uniref:Putative nuclease harbi1 n=1 Tax=Gigaspora margarita TaxID=4874 RepID=A0A8H3X5V5_GIGMA|nr:putative nuclease harbi1 [Gigaspora margarita]